MGVEVKVDLSSNLAVRFDAAHRRGLLAAGAVILALSDAGAPTEPDPRHGEHLVDTGFVRADIVDGVDVAIIGYGAFWAGWQEAHEDWNHPHGGRAKFLELALVEGEAAALEAYAATVREALA